MPEMYALPNGLASDGTYTFKGVGNLVMGAAATAGNNREIIVKKTVGAATQVTLTPTPNVGYYVTVKDGKGDAATNNITIVAAAGNIDGAANYVISANYGGVILRYSGTEWSVIADVTQSGSNSPTFNNLTLTGLLFESAQTGITAGTTRTRAGATALTKEVSRVDTSTAPAAGVTLGDGVVLMASVAGLDATVINNTANIIQVYAAGADTLNGVAGATGVPLPPGDVAQFESAIAGDWRYEAGVGSSGALPVQLAVNGITAGTTRTRAGATALPADINRVDTSTAPATGSTLGDGVSLPAAKAGLDIVCINNTNNIIQVYALTSDTINGIAGVTGVPIPPNATEMFVCATGADWRYDSGVGAAGALNTVLACTGITAGVGGGQGNAIQLVADINRISTIATALDSVMLPVAKAGMDVLIINHGGKTLGVFGNSADTIDDAINTTGVVQMQNSVVLYICAEDGKWYSEGLATGFGGSGLQTQSFTDAVAAAGASQGAATPLTTMVSRVTTGSGGVNLPKNYPGLVITVINALATNLTVYPNQGDADTINGVAAATGVLLPASGDGVFVSTVAGTWIAVGVGGGFSGSLATLLTVGGLTAIAAQNGLVLTGMVNRFTTVGVGNGGTLPVNAVGMSIIVTNDGANALNIWPDTGAAINSLGTNNPTLVPVGATTTFICEAANVWKTPVYPPRQVAGTLVTNGNGTILAATIVGGEVTRTGLTANQSDTTDTAALIIGALHGAAVGQSFEFIYINNTAFQVTFIGGASVTLTALASLTLTCPQNSWVRFLCIIASATTVTMQIEAAGPNSVLQPAKFTSISVGAGTLAAGQASGAAYVSLTSTGATPGSQAMRTVAQVLVDTPGLAVGMTYILRVTNTGLGLFTLATDGSAQFTMTGTMTIPQNSYSDFAVTINTATTGTVQYLSSGPAVSSPAAVRMTSSPTAANVTLVALSDLTVNVAGGQKITGSLMLFANDAGAGADGLQFTMDGGTATMTSFEMGFVSTPVGATLGVKTSTALATALTATTVDTADEVYLIAFSAVINAAGTLIPRFAKNSGNTGNATVKLNSSMTLQTTSN